MSHPINAGVNAPQFAICPPTPVVFSPNMKRMWDRIRFRFLLFPGWWLAAKLSDVGRGHKPKSVAKDVRTCARGLDRDCPHGEIHGFQITSHKSEPVSRVRRLFSKDDCRAALLDEALEFRPKVTLVVKALSRSNRGEGLTGATPGPNVLVVRPSGEAEGAGPPTDTGEKVTLGISSEVVWLDIGN
jgi:hypothetical protein